MLIFKEQIYYLGHLVSGTSILPLANKNEVLMSLKPSTNLKATIGNLDAIMQTLLVP